LRTLISAGLVLGQDIDIEFTGLRPGEKLYGELLISDENGKGCWRKLNPKTFLRGLFFPSRSFILSFLRLF
jgi:hypothetical protein